ncbi:hypothetical protein C8F01DRAFT_996576 [Mycena amicta]|nr:hypothetical protein C8F01DRAFT_996576 [Mycena amicta]
MFNFSDEEVALIRHCIAHVHLPTHEGRPPANLGEKSHGKLKAQEYLILFTTILPLVMPQMWHQGEKSALLLENFYHLVACIAIISSFQTSPETARRYMFHLIEYHKSLEELFPFFPAKPNIHLAMHNLEQLKLWGPLASLSEFFGERINGILASANTNKRAGDLELTMLRHLARRARFEAKLSDTRTTDNLMGRLANILDPVNLPGILDPMKPVSGLEEAELAKNGNNIDQSAYELVLHYLHSVGQTQWVSWIEDIGNLPLDNQFVLSPYCLQPDSIEMDGQTYSCKRSHEGNSGIQFKDPTNPTVLYTGYIETIWSIPLQGYMQTFLLIRKHESVLSPLIEELPFHNHPWFQATIVHATDSDDICIIEPQHIITHLAVYKPTVGAYGLNWQCMVISWALNRGRRT